MKKHTVNYWGKYAPPAYVSNGFIGFRFSRDPFTASTGLLAGFTALRESAEVEAMSVIPTLCLSFAYNGKPAQTKTLSQSYDFSCGEFSTVAELDINGEKADITYTVFASRTSPTLLVSTLSATGDYSGEISAELHFEVAQSHTHTVGRCDYFKPRENHYDGKCHLFSSDDSSSCGIAFRFFGGFENKKCEDEMRASVTLKKNEKLHTIVSYVPNVMHDEPHNQAQRMLRIAEWNGIDRLYEQNRKAWAKLWESRITIEGADKEWQNVIDASYFYLMSSASQFSPTSVAPFGLSHPDAYEGHFFWDTESFMFMTPLFCAPEVAESMLEYRFKRIEAAENNARINGYRGIQFPWQSGKSGCEVTIPVANQAAEHHVTLDIALAFDAFARVHGDPIFIREKLWPLISGVCKFIESRVELTERGYEILHVTGIDEETDDVNNDSYTSLMCQRILRSAAEYAEMLGYGKIKKWTDIADKLIVPVSEDGVLLQYERMPEKELRASTTLMSYFPYGYTDYAENTFKYYISHGMAEYCKYPMLSGFLGVFPAYLGDRETALKFYEMANLTFFCEPFYSCTEWSIPDMKDRIDPTRPLTTNFITARGSLLMGLIMGLTKLCPWKGKADGDIEGWLGENIVLPAGWKKITVGKIYIRGKAYRLEAEHGAKKARLTEI